MKNITLTQILGIKNPEDYYIKLNNFDKYTKLSGRTMLMYNPELLQQHFGHAQGLDKEKISPSYLMNRPYTIHFVRYGNKLWLYAGIFKNGDILIKEDENGFKYREYQLERVPEFDELIGRLVINYEPKNGAQNYKLKLEGIGMSEQFKLHEILSIQDNDLEFSGYDNVSLNFSELKLITEKQAPSWKSVLSEMNAIYIITDHSNGKQYVGSAYGEEKLWSRWSGYAKSYTNGNHDLVHVLKKYGSSHIVNNFHYHILEVLPPNVEKNYVISRESYWKEVLQSRNFGYNRN